MLSNDVRLLPTITCGESIHSVQRKEVMVDRLMAKYEDGKCMMMWYQ